jgi:hypothetical protein
MDPSEVLGTFASVPRFLAAAGRPFNLAPGGDMLACRYDDPRLSAVVAMRRLATVAGGEWLAASVPICRVEALHLRAALVANDELPIGVLAVREGVVLLRQTFPLASLSAALLEEALAALVATAALLVAASATAAGGEAAYRYLFR